MSLHEISAFKHFAEALPEPSGEERVAEMEARTKRMDRAVSELIESLSPSADTGEAQRERNLKVVEGLVASISSVIVTQEEVIGGLSPDGEAALAEARIEVHDDTVRQYYRLIALRSTLDPECRPTGEVLDSSEATDAWFARISAGADAQG
ncbi:MAG: hypothetical protein ABI242_10865 [Caulobacteraceae bacterium]